MQLIEKTWLWGKNLNLRPFGYEPNVQVRQNSTQFVCGTSRLVSVKTAYPQTYFGCFS